MSEPPSIADIVANRKPNNASESSRPKSSLGSFFGGKSRTAARPVKASSGPVGGKQPQLFQGLSVSEAMRRNSETTTNSMKLAELDADEISLGSVRDMKTVPSISEGPGLMSMLSGLRKPKEEDDSTPRIGELPNKKSLQTLAEQEPIVRKEFQQSSGALNFTSPSKKGNRSLRTLMMSPSKTTKISGGGSNWGRNADGLFTGGNIEELMHVSEATTNQKLQALDDDDAFFNAMDDGDDRSVSSLPSVASAALAPPPETTLTPDSSRRRKQHVLKGKEKAKERRSRNAASGGGSSRGFVSPSSRPRSRGASGGLVSPSGRNRGGSGLISPSGSSSGSSNRRRSPRPSPSPASKRQPSAAGPAPASSAELGWIPIVPTGFEASAKIPLAASVDSSDGGTSDDDDSQAEKAPLSKEAQRLAEITRQQQEALAAALSQTIHSVDSVDMDSVFTADIDDDKIKKESKKQEKEWKGIVNKGRIIEDRNGNSSDDDESEPVILSKETQRLQAEAKKKQQQVRSAIQDAPDASDAVVLKKAALMTKQDREAIKRREEGWHTLVDDKEDGRGYSKKIDKDTVDDESDDDDMDQNRRPMSKEAWALEESTNKQKRQLRTAIRQTVDASESLEEMQSDKYSAHDHKIKKEDWHKITNDRAAAHPTYVDDGREYEDTSPTKARKKGPDAALARRLQAMTTTGAEDALEEPSEHKPSLTIFTANTEDIDGDIFKKNLALLTAAGVTIHDDSLHDEPVMRLKKKSPSVEGRKTVEDPTFEDDPRFDTESGKTLLKSPGWEGVVPKKMHPFQGRVEEAPRDGSPRKPRRKLDDTIEKGKQDALYGSDHSGDSSMGESYLITDLPSKAPSSKFEGIKLQTFKEGPDRKPEKRKPSGEPNAKVESNSSSQRRPYGKSKESSKQRSNKAPSNDPPFDWHRVSVSAPPSSRGEPNDDRRAPRAGTKSSISKSDNSLPPEPELDTSVDLPLASGNWQGIQVAGRRENDDDYAYRQGLHLGDDGIDDGSNVINDGSGKQSQSTSPRKAKGSDGRVPPKSDWQGVQIGRRENDIGYRQGSDLDDVDGIDGDDSRKQDQSTSRSTVTGPSYKLSSNKEWQGVEIGRRENDKLYRQESYLDDGHDDDNYDGNSRKQAQSTAPNNERRSLGRVPSKAEWQGVQIGRRENDNIYRQGSDLDDDDDIDDGDSRKQPQSATSGKGLSYQLSSNKEWQGVEIGRRENDKLYRQGSDLDDDADNNSDNIRNDTSGNPEDSSGKELLKAEWQGVQIGRRENGNLYREGSDPDDDDDDKIFSSQRNAKESKGREPPRQKGDDEKGGHSVNAVGKKEVARHHDTKGSPGTDAADKKKRKPKKYASDKDVSDHDVGNEDPGKVSQSSGADTSQDNEQTPGDSFFAGRSNDPFSERPPDAGPFASRPPDAGPFAARPGQVNPFATRPEELNPFAVRPPEAGPFAVRPTAPGNYDQQSGERRKLRLPVSSAHSVGSVGSESTDGSPSTQSVDRHIVRESSHRRLLRKKVEDKRSNLEKMVQKTNMYATSTDDDLLDLKRKLALSQALVQQLEVENAEIQRQAVLDVGKAQVALLEQRSNREKELEQQIKKLMGERNEAVDECHYLRILITESCPTCRNRLENKEYVMDESVRNTIISRRTIPQSSAFEWFTGNDPSDKAPHNIVDVSELGNTAQCLDMNNPPLGICMHCKNCIHCRNSMYNHSVSEQDPTFTEAPMQWLSGKISGRIFAKDDTAESNQVQPGIPETEEVITYKRNPGSSQGNKNQSIVGTSNASDGTAEASTEESKSNQAGPDADTSAGTVATEKPVPENKGVPENEKIVDPWSALADITDNKTAISAVDINGKGATVPRPMPATRAQNPNQNPGKNGTKKKFFASLFGEQVEDEFEGIALQGHTAANREEPGIQEPRGKFSLFNLKEEKVEEDAVFAGVEDRLAMIPDSKILEAMESYQATTEPQESTFKFGLEDEQVLDDMEILNSLLTSTQAGAIGGQKAPTQLGPGGAKKKTGLFGLKDEKFDDDVNDMRILGKAPMYVGPTASRPGTLQTGARSSHPRNQGPPKTTKRGIFGLKAEKFDDDANDMRILGKTSMYGGPTVPRPGTQETGERTSLPRTQEPSKTPKRGLLGLRNEKFDTDSHDDQILNLLMESKHKGRQQASSSQRKESIITSPSDPDRVKKKLSTRLGLKGEKVQDDLSFLNPSPSRGAGPSPRALASPFGDGEASPRKRLSTNKGRRGSTAVNYRNMFLPTGSMQQMPSLNDLGESETAPTTLKDVYSGGAVGTGKEFESMANFVPMDVEVEEDRPWRSLRKKPSISAHIESSRTLEEEPSHVEEKSLGEASDLNHLASLVERENAWG